MDDNEQFLGEELYCIPDYHTVEKIGIVSVDHRGLVCCGNPGSITMDIKKMGRNLCIFRTMVSEYNVCQQPDVHHFQRRRNQQPADHSNTISISCFLYFCGFCGDNLILDILSWIELK